MRLCIHTYGDPVLREAAQPLHGIDEALRKLAQDMIETMHAEGGIGLAAQQIGRVIPLCVVDLPTEMDQDEDGQPVNPGITMPMVLVNPVVLHAADRKWPRDEGCLSFPDIMGRIERPWTITLRYMDLDGTTHEDTFHGMLARVMQHEIDHLNGVLFIDRMSHVKRLALKGRLRRLQQETQETVEQRLSGYDDRT